MIAAHVWTSVAVLCQELVTEFKADNLSENLDFVDWESHANIEELPDTDLLGPNGISITEESPEIFSVVFGIGVSTYGEDVVFRLRAMSGRVFERLRVLKELPLVHSDSGEVITTMKVVDGTNLLPIGRASTRPYQLIQVECVVLPPETSTTP